MDSDFPHQTGLRPRHALAGLQAGVLGALLMLACMMIGSMWNRRSIWVGPNLFATTFYGQGVYYNHYAPTAWAGVALFVVFYGALGSVWGCAWREEEKPMLGVYGAIVGLVVYFILFDFVWKQANGLVVLYAPNTQLEFGHALWGLMLSKSPLYARRIAERLAERLSDEAPQAASPEPNAAEVHTPEPAAGAEPAMSSETLPE